MFSRKGCPWIGFYLEKVYIFSLIFSWKINFLWELKMSFFICLGGFSTNPSRSVLKLKYLEKDIEACWCFGNQCSWMKEPFLNIQVNYLCKLIRSCLLIWECVCKRCIVFTFTDAELRVTCHLLAVVSLELLSDNTVPSISLYSLLDIKQAILLEVHHYIMWISLLFLSVKSEIPDERV